MPYVNVPNDLSKIKTKIAFNLTRRQLICFGGAAAVGIPVYLLTRHALGGTGAMFLMIALNETCSRPPTDLRGSPCGMRQPSTGSGTVGLCSRSHRRSGILPVPGMRGKYGTQQSYREPSNRVFLSYDSPNHSGAAAPYLVD